MTYLGSAVIAAGFGLSLSMMVPRPDAGNANGSGSSSSMPLYPITRPVNVLIMGVDVVAGAKPGTPESFQGRSDTMLLVRMDTSKDGVTVLSIPRDTQVEIPNYGLTKVNHANWIGGPRMTRDVLSHNLNNVSIDRYIRVNTGAFRELVDLVGGVRVFVPKRMEYEDKTQKLKIDLQPGWQTLNGDQAEQFSRFRHDELGDIGRVQRQQMMLKALREKVASPAMLPRLPKLLEVFKTYVDTNLSTEEMLALATYGLQLRPEQLKMVMLPGRASEPAEFKASYWIMDTKKRDSIISDYFGQTSGFGSTFGSWPGQESQSKDDITSLHIAVQNASGQPDQGRAMANKLKDLGFGDVYVVEDWPETIERTQIVIQKGDLAAAKQMRDRLGIGLLAPDSTGNLESDLTIRVGSDWKP
jgi:polyisoprenyl-teichoic acid--peptidoglycan teichoic acid transferase